MVDLVQKVIYICCIVLNADCPVRKTVARSHNMPNFYHLLFAFASTITIILLSLLTLFSHYSSEHFRGKWTPRKPGQRKRQGSSRSNIGRICLGFLDYVGELYLEPFFIGSTGTIRAEIKEVKLVNQGKQVTRTYWYHHSFPHPEPQTRRLPISSEEISQSSLRPSHM
ncbi:Uncharacterised protein [Cedecea lapagei]|uniref:Uncharacterized protein n=1 Tax=Cedecea lapagei TaxID=158823 RepID=A0A447V208_9ENTR|nr:Uncharacterised protein [Cedecea lapagei]